MTTFTLTEEHLALARHMWVGWNDIEFGAPEIDPKRPYGNSDVVSDVAKIVGEPWPDTDRERDVFAVRMSVIHGEMETALQIILGRAGQAVEPGIYRNTADRYHRPQWERLP